MWQLLQCTIPFQKKIHKAKSWLMLSQNAPVSLSEFFMTGICSDWSEPVLCQWSSNVPSSSIVVLY